MVLQYAAKKRPPTTQLVCICANFQVGPAHVSKLLISPRGKLVFRLSSPVDENVLDALVEELMTWRSAKLDELAAAYTYRTQGQAVVVIDLMARRGCLTYSDGARLKKLINRNFSSGRFIIAM